MASTSSSEDEDTAKFIEATDCSVQNNYLSKTEEKVPSLPSLRDDFVEEVNLHRDLQVTPAFQKHVANHLSQILDSQLLLEDNCQDTTNISNESGEFCPRKFARAKRLLAPARLGQSADQVSIPESSTKAANSNSGVRLFGASAVFLSNLGITPANVHQRHKKRRRAARFSSDSESSSEESRSDSDDMEKFSSVAVTPDWVLSGTATKGWTEKAGKIERCIINEAGVLIPVKDGKKNQENVARSSVNINNNDMEVLSDRAKDDMAFLQSKKKNRKKEKKRALSLDGDTLAASFKAAVRLSADAPSEATSRGNLKSKWKKRKCHHSEDGTTETTEVEDTVEERRKKKKKRKKQKKKSLKNSNNEEAEMWEHAVPGLLEDEEDDHGSRNKEKRKKKKRNKKKKDKLRAKLNNQISSRKSKNFLLSLTRDTAKLTLSFNKVTQDAPVVIFN